MATKKTQRPSTFAHSDLERVISLGGGEWCRIFPHDQPGSVHCRVGSEAFREAIGALPGGLEEVRRLAAHHPDGPWGQALRDLEEAEV